MLSRKVYAAFGRSVYSNRIRQEQLSIRRLFRLLSEPVIRREKDGDYFVFAKFDGNKRNAKSVIEYYGATLDLDDAELSPREIKKIFRDYCFSIYSTYSHREEGKGDRYRIVVPYREPVLPDEHRKATMALRALLGDAGGKDYSDKALSRPMYLPAVPRAREDLFYSYDQDGDFYDAAAAELPAELAFMESELAGSFFDRIDITESKTEGGRNEHIARLAGSFIGRGMAFSEALDACLALNLTKFDPPLDEKEVKRTVQSIYDAHGRNGGGENFSADQLAEQLETVKKLDDIEAYNQKIAAALVNNKCTGLQLEALVDTLQKKSGGKFSKGAIKKDIKDKAVSLRDRVLQNKQTEALAEGDAEEDLSLNSLSAEGLRAQFNRLKRDFQDTYFLAPSNTMYEYQSSTEYRVDGWNTQNNMVANRLNIKDAFHRFLIDNHIIQSVEGLGYHPAKKEVYENPEGRLLLNTYRAPNIREKACDRSDVRIMLRHFRYLFPDRKQRNILLDFIAMQVQFPGVKIRWVPVVRSAKGVGKGIIAEKLICPLIGASNYMPLPNNHALMGRFNAWQSGYQVVVLHELNRTGSAQERTDLVECLKSFVTDDTVMIERKGKDGVKSQNITNMIIFTNHDEVLVITPDERRFCMLRSYAEKRSKEYYSTLVTFLENNMDKIRYYFMNRKIRIDPNELPETEYTKEVKGNNVDSTESTLTSLLEDPSSLINEYQAVTYETICNSLRAVSPESGMAALEGIESFGSSRAHRLMHALGQLNFRQVISPGRTNGHLVNGRNTVIFITPMGVKRRFHKAPLTAIIAEAASADNRLEDFVGV